MRTPHSRGIGVKLARFPQGWGIVDIGIDKSDSSAGLRDFLRLAPRLCFAKADKPYGPVRRLPIVRVTDTWNGVMLSHGIDPTIDRSVDMKNRALLGTCVRSYWFVRSDQEPTPPAKWYHGLMPIQGTR